MQTHVRSRYLRAILHTVYSKKPLMMDLSESLMNSYSDKLPLERTSNTVYGIQWLRLYKMLKVTFFKNSYEIIFPTFPNNYELNKKGRKMWWCK